MLPAQPPADVRRWATAAWDASAAVLPDAVAVVVLPEPADEAAEKSADPAPDDPAPDAMQWELPAELASAAAPYRPAVVQFAEQSCAAAAPSELLALRELTTSAPPAELRSPQLAEPLARKSRALRSSAPVEAELPVAAALPEVLPRRAAHSS